CSMFEPVSESATGKTFIASSSAHSRCKARKPASAQAATTAVVTARCSPVDTPRSSRPPVHVTFSLPATLFELSATCADHPRRRRSVRRGCRVRRLWQGAGLRQVGLALSPTSQPPVEPEHPDRARARRHLPAEAPQRMHVLPEGGQGHPVVR